MKNRLIPILVTGMLIQPITSYAETNTPTTPPAETESTVQTGWVTVEGSWYYYNELGEMQTGWYEIDGNSYYFHPQTGVRQHGWLTIGEHSYYLDAETGIRQQGWLFLDGNWYYIHPDTKQLSKGWILDRGKWYYLNQDGVMHTGWIYYNSKWYYMNQTGEMATGWVLDNQKWFYLDASGVMKTGWLQIGNKWYYLLKNGEMKTGWLQDHNKKWYYLDPVSGMMKTGWFQHSNYRWYYAYSSGLLAQNTTIGADRVGVSGAWIPDIVNPRKTYTYDQMMYDISRLKSTYPDFVHTEVIGQSVDGRSITAVRLGKGSSEVFFNGSHHAREHITTNLLMEMMDQYASSYADGVSFAGYNTTHILNNSSIWFVPMVNPDGVTLVQKGATSAKNPAYVMLLNGNSADFSSWKANIRGVDLNRQYPADWNSIVNDTGHPSPMNFKGYSPLSEPEVIALYNFTKKHSFKTTVSYHSSGEILYWYYKQTGANYNRDYSLAVQYGNMTGYSLVQPTTNISGGGYKDWFIQETGLPAFTPEVSPYTGGQPVPIANFDTIWNQNKKAGLWLADEASKR
ncbi:hypothetical protein FZW96_07160 [Bacillus sp. BGMRC 2118]|nr:hypothetical protein FZW96_07160 [Bacillus sp. BGMRC 2118]